METPSPDRQRRAGILYSLGAYTCWGLFPLYLNLVRRVTPFEFVLHRMIWSVLFVFAILGVRGKWNWLRDALRSWRTIGGFAASAAILSLNWFLFVWAADAGRVVDASLGYFINPLVSVALGAVFLKERLQRLQVAAVALASLGVLWLVAEVGQVPWIGLALAASFATYGLLRKTARLGALEGLALETLLLSPIAMVGFGWLVAHGQSRFVEGGLPTRALVLMAGPVTTIPLLLFAAGARRVPLSMLGLLQYIGPTLQLMVGVIVLHEPFKGDKLVGYALIWLGFGVASVDAFRAAAKSNGSESRR
jgi:chloramphenicol-sensitive protein RarD